MVVVPDLQKTPIGARIRFLRKRQGLTIPDLERLTGISHGTISRLERGGAVVNVAAVGKLLAYFGRDWAEAFPGVKDVYDFLVPPKDFASWLRNFRLRRGLQQAELAKVLGVSKVTICHYEGSFCKPRPLIQERLRKAFNLDGAFDRFL